MWKCIAIQTLRPIACATSPPTSSPAATDEEIEDPRPLAEEIIRQWVEPASRIRFFPGPQIQDRGGARPEHDRAAMQYHDMAVSDRGRTPKAAIGYKVMGRRRHGPQRPYIAHVMREFRGSARISSPIWESSAARLQPGQSPRQYPQAAHQDTDQHHRGRRKCASAWRASSRKSSATGSLQLAPGRTGPASPPIFATPQVRDRPAPMLLRDAGADFANWGLRPISTSTARRAMPSFTITLKDAGSGCRGDATADQMDYHCRSDGPVQRRRSTGDARTKSGCLPHVRKKGPAGDLRHAQGNWIFASTQCRADHRHYRLPRCPGTIATWPMRVRFRSPRASPKSSRISTASMRSANSRSRFPAASMPAATTMPAISAILGVDKKGVGILPADPGRFRRGRRPASARSWGPGFGEHEIADAGGARGQCLSDRGAPARRTIPGPPIGRIGMAPFKDAAYEKVAA